MGRKKKLEDVVFILDIGFVFFFPLILTLPGLVILSSLSLGFGALAYKLITRRNIEFPTLGLLFYLFALMPLIQTLGGLASMDGGFRVFVGGLFLMEIINPFFFLAGRALRGGF